MSEALAKLWVRLRNTELRPDVMSAPRGFVCAFCTSSQCPAWWYTVPSSCFVASSLRARKNKINIQKLEIQN